jgi:hypothetical protein
MEEPFLHLGPRKLDKRNIKSMLICSVEADGIVHKEFIPPGQTVDIVMF